MRWFDNLRISLKIALPFGLILILAAGAGAVAVNSMLRAQGLNRELAAATSEVRQLRELQTYVESTDAAVTDYLITLDPRWRTLVNSDIRQLVDSIAAIRRFDNAHPEDLETLDAFQGLLDDTWLPAIAAVDRVVAGSAEQSSLQPYLDTAGDPEGHQAISEPFAQHIETDHAQGIRDRLASDLDAELTRGEQILYGLLLLVTLLSTLALWMLGRYLSRRFRRLQEAAERIGEGHLEEPVAVPGVDEIGLLALSFDEMRQSLASLKRADDAEARVQSTLLGVSRAMQEQQDAQRTDEAVLRTLAHAAGVPHAVLYETSATDETLLIRRAAIGAADGHLPASSILLREGLVGQAAADREPRFLSAPDGYLTVASALGASPPAEIAVIPCVAHGRTLGVLEIASFNTIDPYRQRMLTEAADLLALHIAVRQAQTRTVELLAESQAQAIELESQADELQQQTTELEEANSQLEEGSAQLEEQQNLLAERNAALQMAHDELVRRTEMVDQASSYKSAFLAKMSHELRTPLNSILILSDRLAKDPDASPSERRVEFAETIRACGKDLLSLINDVLDLSKVESGAIDIVHEETRVADICGALERQFAPVALEHGLAFTVTISADAPATITADRLRVEQILKNLLSNAMKFTDEGGVYLRVHRLGDRVRLEVEDTGVGIAAEHLEAVFEPFRQVGAARSRNASGTGLGLSISSELAHRMGGELVLRSEVGVGSVFELTLPIAQVTQAGTSVLPIDASVPEASVPEAALPDSNAVDVPLEATEYPTGRLPGQPVLLIIEDDTVFASLIAHEAVGAGFFPVFASSGNAAVEHLEAGTPDAITLDLGLPDMDGWVLLDRIRHSHSTKHTPIQVISASGDALNALEVQGKLVKPVSAEQLSAVVGRLAGTLRAGVRRLLLIGVAPSEAAAISTLLDATDLEIHAVADAAAAVSLARDHEFDAAVVDVGASTWDGPELLRALRSDEATASIPMIALADTQGEIRENRELVRLANAIVTKDEMAQAKLVSETAKFLHRLGADFSQQQQHLVDSLPEQDSELAGRLILVVDDDPRNIFALSTILEQYELQIVDAENGQVALDILRERDDVDLVLMDVMMPVMDGLEATRRIRANPSTTNLPVVVVTAAAMPEDRQRSLAAGASDYLTKPIDPEQLISLIRVWLHARAI